jgi:hypothetical protein
MYKIIDFKKHFWSKVNRHSGHFYKGTECWEWTGCTACGYGMAYASTGRYVKAHRFAWTLLGGVIPHSLGVLHKCDNRICVRPSHLFLGNNAANVADMVAKGRQRGAPSKLTDKQVGRIRQDYAFGVSGPRLAAKYKITKNAVYKILAGIVRKDAPGPVVSVMREASAYSTNVGESNGRSILNAMSVRAIRRRPHETAALLAARYEVSMSTIAAIRSCRIWKHVV